MNGIVRVLCGLMACVWLSADATVSRSDDRPPPDATAELEFFERRVRPLLAQRCFECHADREKGAKGGLRLDTGRGIAAGGESGPVVAAGKPDESLLIEAVRYETEGLQMPPRGKLPEAEVAILVEWVRRGALIPREPEQTAPNAAVHGIDIEAGRKHWAFLPLPAVTADYTQRFANDPSRIDRQVATVRASAGLASAPQADRRTLLRRLSFDLTGLPPTQAELDAFMSNDAPDAWAHEIDRLLGSPHYGERWARFWLDLVRYCDVPEAWMVERRAKAWLYRDWVVHAFNDNLPFDRFLELQLAADLVPEVQPADLAALGFLGLSPTYWKELKLDPSVIKTVVAEEWEERIHTLSGAILGLTVACARCHDHKMDPIRQDDYYALAGVLASTRLAPRALLPGDQSRTVAQAHERAAQWELDREELQKHNPRLPEAPLLLDDINRRLRELEHQTPGFDAPLAYAVEEASLHVLPDGPDRTRLEYRPGEPQNVPVHVRGNPGNAGSVVSRRFLEVLSPEAPVLFREGSGRRELARAFVREAAPLTARVFVNRVWQQLFGHGLVETPSNFGTTGARPSHPELLDDLAARFVASGWSIKWLHRELVLTATYRQSSAFDPAAHAIDPENRLLWRASRRRLDVEAWRDAMLAATGKLERTIGGPDRSLDDPANLRRTLYATVKRRELHPMLRLLDFPDPTTHIAARDSTTTPLQLLFVLNSPFMLEQARALAECVARDAPGDINGQIAQAYRRLFGREPQERERELARAYLSPQDDNPPRREALWREFCQILLASNELAYLD